MKRYAIGFFLFFWTAGVSFSQGLNGADGVQVGSIQLRPEASVLGAHDNRVQYDAVNGAESDFYSEVSAALYLNNLPARYDLSGHARYGYRFYSDFSDRNNDFYSARAAVASSQNPLYWGVSGDLTKTLNYGIDYDPSTGDGPDSILSNQPNRRWLAKGHLGYKAQASDKTAITPEYNGQHYLQEFEDGGTEEWQIHKASVEVGHDYSSRTRVFAAADCSLQANDDEDGYIATAEVGAESRITDKTTWMASVGIAAADYELSGADESGIFNLRATWRPNDQVSTYVFGGNSYQPGHGGGAARLLYRAGYGADWAFTERWTLGGSGLHDYQQELGGGDGSTYGGVRHFFNVQCGYDITRKLDLMFSGRYVNDEIEVDQVVWTLKLNYAY